MTGLQNAHFTVISVKTLNDTQANAGIVEVACAKVQGLKIVETYHTLTNPETIILEEFTRQTGIYPAMLVEQPVLDEVLPKIAAFAGRDILVWWNHPKASNRVYRTFEKTQPRDKTLFIRDLAEKALPDLKKRQLHLEYLAEHFQIEPGNITRASAMAETSASVLIQLLKIAQAEQGIERFEELLAWCPPPKPSRIRTRNDLPFQREKLKDYPSQPGVYFMKNRLGEILYVGKAKNLKNRLQSYFQKQSRLAPKIAAMMKQVSRIDVTTVGSELEALLLEARLIKEHQPFFNRKVKHYQHMVFLKIAMGDVYPQVGISLQDEAEASDPEAIYFGPFASRMDLEANLQIINRIFKLRSCNDAQFAQHRQDPCMQAQIGLCSGPCANWISGSEYRDSVQDFVAYLEGNPSYTIDYLIAKREAYAEALLFEKAADIQRGLEHLEALQLRSYRLIQAMARHNLFIILPDAEPGAFRILSVWQGRPWDWHTYHPNRDSQDTLQPWVDALCRQVHPQAFESVRPALAHYPTEQPTVRTGIPKLWFEEARLLCQWLEQQGGRQGWAVYLKQKTPQQILDELYEVVAQEDLTLDDATDDTDWEAELCR